ncbi:hypothetical protein GQ53DRAFT_751834 [Thozetella sp. PMI_491]|nr:hypothetical protein GQ53DRAFT_751834 [Thozetella sp. PMI_491]
MADLEPNSRRALPSGPQSARGAPAANATTPTRRQSTRAGRRRSVHIEEPEEEWRDDPELDHDAVPGNARRFSTGPANSRHWPNGRHQSAYYGESTDLAGDATSHADHPRSYGGSGGGLPVPWGFHHNPYPTAPAGSPYGPYGSHTSSAYYPPPQPPPPTSNPAPFYADPPPLDTTTNPFAPRSRPPAATPHSAQPPFGRPATTAFSHRQPYGRLPPAAQYGPGPGYGTGYDEMPSPRQPSSTAAQYDMRELRDGLDDIDNEQQYYYEQEDDTLREREERRRRASEEQEKKRRKEARRRKMDERLDQAVRNRVEAELRKQGPSRNYDTVPPRDYDTYSDPGRRHLEWEHKILLEAVLNRKQADDTQSMTSRGSRRTAEVEEILDIIELVKDRERRRTGRTGLELELARPRELARRGSSSAYYDDVYTTVVDAMRQVMKEDIQETRSAPDDRAETVNSAMFEDERRRARRSSQVPESPVSRHPFSPNDPRPQFRDFPPNPAPGRRYDTAQAPLGESYPSIPRPQQPRRPSSAMSGSIKYPVPQVLTPPESEGMSPDPFGEPSLYSSPPPGPVNTTRGTRNSARPGPNGSRQSDRAQRPTLMRTASQARPRTQRRHTQTEQDYSSGGESDGLHRNERSSRPYVHRPPAGGPPPPPAPMPPQPPRTDTQSRQGRPRAVTFEDGDEDEAGENYGGPRPTRGSHAQNSEWW